MSRISLLVVSSPRGILNRILCTDYCVRYTLQNLEEMIMAYPVSLPKINRMSSALLRNCNGRLLPHQVEALESLCSRNCLGGPNANNDIALVCMPTGSGKTGVIAALPYYLASIKVDGQPRYLFDKPILVVAPDVAIQNQLVEELTPLTRKTPFLKRINIVPPGRDDILPVSMKVDSTAELRNQQRLKSMKLVIANAQKFGGTDWIEDLDSDLFRLVIVDEAHHHPATTWRRIVEKFHNTKCPVVFFTATPFRTDGQRVLGLQEDGIAYHLSLKDAVQRRIIRQSNFDPISEVDTPSFHDPEAYTEDERLSAGKMAAILRKVKQLLDFKNTNFCEAPHMAIAICNNTKQSSLLLELWQNFYPESEEPAECYNSEQPKYELERIMKRIKSNELSLVIIVGMLLEGFDHPPISIAAITHRKQSPVRFVQFVGRAQRIYRREGYDEPEELLANIVTHEDFNKDENYEKFTTEALIPVEEPEPQGQQPAQPSD